MFCAWCGNEVATVSYAPCARCGRPTNGAQTVLTSSGGGRNPAVVILVVIFGGFFAIAIIGIIAAIAIPNALTAMQRSKQARTMADMRSIATAVEGYASDNNAYPEVTSVDELRPVLTPKYARTLSSVDGWAHPFKYLCAEKTDGKCSGYVIVSAGKDGVFEHDDPHEYLGGQPLATTNFDNDLVYSNGQFLQYPEGKH